MNNLFYGVPKVRLIWHGEWTEPEVNYKGHLFNYYYIEEELWGEYKKQCRRLNENTSTGGFKRWIKRNHELVYRTLEILRQQRINLGGN